MTAIAEDFEAIRAGMKTGLAATAKPLPVSGAPQEFPYGDGTLGILPGGHYVLHAKSPIYAAARVVRALSGDCAIVQELFNLSKSYGEPQPKP